MTDVIDNSTSKLTAADRKAMAAYLKRYRPSPRPLTRPSDPHTANPAAAFLSYSLPWQYRYAYREIMVVSNG